MACSQSRMELLSAELPLSPGLRLGLQREWAAGPRQQWQPADPVQSGGPARHPCPAGTSPVVQCAVCSVLDPCFLMLTGGSAALMFLFK